MLDSYRRVLSRPGAFRFSSAGLVARLPMSMVTLGVVLLVEGETGSYGVAGVVSGVVVLGQASCAVLHGRLVDRFGQGRVLPLAITGFAVSMALLVLAVTRDWPMLLTYVLAALTGAFQPQVGACVRTRWSHLLDRPREVQTAYALESVLDEVVFVVGPVLATMLATLWHPVAGLVVAVVAGLAGTYAFAAQRATEPPSGQHRRGGARLPMPWRTVLPLALVCLSLGALFGSAEVTTVAFAEEAGSRAVSGWLLAVWAVGSMLAGIVTGAIAWKRGPAVRVRWGSFAMMLAMVPPVFVEGFPLMFLALLVGGCSIAPTLIATMSLTEQTVPPGRLTEGMAILHTGLMAGVAPGAAIAGFVVDHHGASAAYLVAVVAGFVAVVGAQATRTRSPAPVSLAG
jgi:MFS family permease